MKVIALVGFGTALVVVVALGLRLGGRPSEEVAHTTVTAADPSDATALRSADPPRAAITAVGGSVSGLTNQTAASEREVLAFLDSLLKEPLAASVRMGDTPHLDEKSEAALIERCSGLRGILEKAKAWQILAYRGGDASLVVLTNALLNDYVSRPVEPGESTKLLALPLWIGLMSQRNQAAYEFLLDASNPEFWQGRPLWVEGPTSPAEWMLFHRSVRGLLTYNRSEGAERVLESYRTDPNRAVKLGVDAVLLSAMYGRSMIDQLGIEEWRDTVCSSPDGGFQMYERWLEENDDAQKWKAWRVRALTAVRAERDKQSGP